MRRTQGLAIISVFKAGFLGSGRFGSGIVVARLADGTWSAPSAIGTLGGGFGGQIGFELTDFVFILNDSRAVKTFAQAGSITLGGNVSIAAGPVGRNAEAAGAASLKSVSGIFAYSKTKGLFAGVSLEGSVMIERRDANSKLYGANVKAADLLSGSVPVPPAAEPLMLILNSRVFAGTGISAAAASGSGDAMYNDIPIYDDAHDDVIWQNRTGAAYGEGVRTDRTGTGAMVRTDTGGAASSWADDVYDREPAARLRSQSTRSSGGVVGDDYVYSDRPRASSSASAGGPGRPTAPKPVFGQATGARRSTLGADQAIAKFTFDADQPGDLGFKKGEVITILKRTENETDWWTGKIGERQGIFPR